MAEEQLAAALGHLEQLAVLDELTRLIDDAEQRRLEHVLQLVALLEVVHLVERVVARREYVGEERVHALHAHVLVLGLVEQLEVGLEQLDAATRQVDEPIEEHVESIDVVEAIASGLEQALERGGERLLLEHGGQRDLTRRIALQYGLVHLVVVIVGGDDVAEVGLLRPLVLDSMPHLGGYLLVDAQRERLQLDHHVEHLGHLVRVVEALLVLLLLLHQLAVHVRGEHAEQARLLLLDAIVLVQLALLLQVQVGLLAARWRHWRRRRRRRRRTGRSSRFTRSWLTYC